VSGVAAIALLLATPLSDAVRADESACPNLSGIQRANTRITTAAVIDAGAFKPDAGNGAALRAFAALPAFCRVAATLTPSADSDIKTEVWLPLSGWNGRLQVVGNGGWAGTIPYSAMASALTSGYVAAGTDTGHTGGTADFALGHTEKLIDFGYRSMHELTVHAKAVLKAHYGTEQKFSYYNGCSQGGRQGLTEAQRFPEDFNGIVAGAPSWDQMRLHAARVALNVAVNATTDNVIPPAKYKMIHDAVLSACDAQDGAKDAVIEYPPSCGFDYASLLCKGGDASTCLTAGQVASARAMTSPITDPKSGRVLYVGHLAPGSELGWATLGGPEPLNLSTSGMRTVVFQNPAWDYHRIDVSTDLDRAAKSDAGATFSGNPNLTPFFRRGGKLLMYHGWSDPQVNPFTSVIYYDQVVKSVGQAAAAKSIALFMVPGMNHCSGGPGTDTFDKMQAMTAWVENATTPVRITASHLTGGQPDKTRPLCSYPQVARYNGSGDMNDAASFTCAQRQTP
jgi:feruloyl esterase